MTGPVWRFERGVEARCSICFREGSEFYVEGSVASNALNPERRVCPDCYARETKLVVVGELGARSSSPAYVGKR